MWKGKLESYCKKINLYTDETTEITKNIKGVVK